MSKRDETWRSWVDEWKGGDDQLPEMQASLARQRRRFVLGPAVTAALLVALIATWIHRSSTAPDLRIHVAGSVGLLIIGVVLWTQVKAAWDVRGVGAESVAECVKRSRMQLARRRRLAITEQWVGGTCLTLVLAWFAWSASWFLASQGGTVQFLVLLPVTVIAFSLAFIHGHRFRRRIEGELRLLDEMDEPR